MSEVPATYIGSTTAGGQNYILHKFVFEDRDQVIDDTRKLVERIRHLERELREAREALFAAERRENDLIERMRDGL